MSDQVRLDCISGRVCDGVNANGHVFSVDSDFLLVLLQDVLKKRKDLKLILMSATINQELFSGTVENT
jgi:hypothetical protein